MDGTQIYDNFTAGRPEVLQAIGDSINDLSRGYRDELTAIVALQKRMSQSWTGASGDAAGAGAGPLAVAFGDSSVPLDETTNAMNAQTGSLGTAKSSVVPVPPAPQKPSGWSTVLKAAIPVVGPSMAVSDITSYQDGMDKHNAANETNVRVMQQYSSATNSTQSTIPMSYQPLQSDGTSVSVKPASPNVVSGHLTSEYTNVGNTSTSVPAPSSGGPAASGPVSPPPRLNTTGPVTSVAPVGPNIGPVSRPPNLSGGRVPGGTGSNAYVPGPAGGTGGSDTQRTGSSYRGGASGGNTPGGAGRGGNSAANRLYGSAEETSRRGGGGAAGESARSAGANRLGGGKSTGAGNLGNAAAAEEAAAGRSGARGASGAPMGAAGQRGRGEEDQEHQRPDYLLEADPDSIFGNDIRATPPVIGE
ncbi:hypothetical protein [Amycolatopsis alkalitolerans]|uniref:PPE domain-containing protein n=1 Tax=Amycolatopsis alkalitolerans TaxID=2547244 RepID=A0A5C4LR96_9PSEU|nr:hypothetical protein [Amycolatopsis alkalitolerans]TNC21183.1 hypothetical protein FG385_29015 [Amycolatopsis alkalitolerans]